MHGKRLYMPIIRAEHQCCAVQMLMHVISFAFLVVIASTAMFVPILLYVFGLNKLGWNWQHAALFSAMIASTDAVAVSAILKKGTSACSNCRLVSVTLPIIDHPRKHPLWKPLDRQLFLGTSALVS